MQALTNFDFFDLESVFLFSDHTEIYKRSMDILIYFYLAVVALEKIF